MKAAYQVVQKLMLTEKGAILSESNNQYIFRVAPAANKLEIKSAIEDLFKVSVVKVNTMVRVGKKRRERSMQYGMTSPWKRAVVTLKDGDTIDLT